MFLTFVFTCWLVRTRSHQPNRESDSDHEELCVGVRSGALRGALRGGALSPSPSMQRAFPMAESSWRTLAHCMQDHPTTHPQRLREGRQGPAVAAVAATARCATGFMLKAPQCPGDGSWTLSPWDPAMSHRVPR